MCTLEKWIVLLDEIGIMVATNKPLDKKNLEEAAEKKEIDLSEAEFANLSLLSRSLYKKIKSAERPCQEERREMIRLLLLESADKLNLPISMEEEEISPPIEKMESSTSLAIKMLEKKNPLRENIHLLVREVCEEIDLSKEERREFRLFARNFEFSSEEGVASSSFSDALEELKDLLFWKPIEVNKNKISSVAAKHNVDFHDLKKALESCQEEVLERRKKTEIIK